MSQFLEPTSDVVVDTWGFTPLWSALADATDATIIKTPLANIAEYECEVAVAAGTNPLRSDGHQVLVRAQRGVSGVIQRLRVRLVATSTVAAEWFVTLTDTLTDYALDVGGALSAYNDLRLRIKRLNESLTGQYAIVSRARVILPDPAFAHLDIDPSGPGLVVVAPASGHYLTLSAPGYLRVAGVETTGALVLGATGIEVHA